MSLFSKAGCPLPPARREWIDGRWRFLLREFGDGPAARSPVVVPTADFFPGGYRPTRAGVRRLFPRVARWMGLDPGSIRLVLSGPRRASGRGLAFAFAGTVSGWYRGGRPPRVALHAARFDDPVAVVGTLAHELGHVHLLGARRVAPEAEDHEPLTDLLTVFFGLGVFRAHGLASASRPRGVAARAGFPVQETGYLDALHFGYAMALHARLRGEGEDAPWAAYLPPAVRAAFERSTRFLRA